MVTGKHQSGRSKVDGGGGGGGEQGWAGRLQEKINRMNSRAETTVDGTT